MSTAPRSEPGLGFDPERLVKTHQAGVWRYLRALGCTPSQADDLTQETFLAVLQRPFKEINDTATGAYLRRTAFNHFVSLQRRAGKVNAVPDVEEFDRAWTDWVEDDDGQELVDHLKSCLERLTERARTALTMRFADKATRKAIAEHLEITEHGAKNLMQRAKQTLRGCIEGKLES